MPGTNIHAHSIYKYKITNLFYVYISNSFQFNLSALYIHNPVM